MRLSSRERWIGFVATALTSLYIWFTLQPDLLLSNTTANGGDTGAHVWWPAFLRDHILTKWRLTGWSPDWYAGFPAGVFYFPLPSLLVVVLDVFLPYNVAFKLVTALGPIMLPIAAYAFARGIGARWPAPPLFAVATLPYTFYTGYTIWGGNLASTLAGEFSFCIAIGLGLFFLGALARALDERTGFGLPAVLLAATVMSHLIVTVFVAVGALVIWLQRRPLRNLSVAAAIGGVGALITAIWSVPLVLRLGYTTDMGWTKEPPMGPNKNLLPNDLRWAFILAAVAAVPALFHAGAELLAYLRRRERPEYPQTRATRAVLAMAVIFGVAFVVIPEARLWNARILPFYYLMVMFLAASALSSLVTPLTRAAPAIGSGLWRLISEPEPEPEELAPVASDGQEPVPAPVALSTPEPAPPPAVEPPLEAVPVYGPPEPGLGPSEAVLGPPEPRAIPSDDAPRRRAVPAWLVSALVVAVALCGAMQYSYKTRSFLPAWIRWNYSGYESKPAYPEFREVITTMAKLPPGRALWEPSSAIDHYGTTLALELLPHFTDGRIASMEGLYFESGATTPYHFVMVSALAKQPSNPVRSMAPYYRTLADFDLGVAQMRDMGVNYYMAQSDEAKAKADASPGLRFITETGSPNVTPQVARWKIYEVLDSPLVAPLTYEPVVMEGAAKKQWLQPSAQWFDDASALDRPLTDSGPADWARAPAASAISTAKKPLPAVTVSNVKSGDDYVSFDVSEPGVPVLVKTSYFPNWQAKGAKGPFRATPNEMVVVPTGTHVSLHYGRTPVDWAGTILTVLGLVGLAGLAKWKLDPLAARPPRRRRVQTAGGPPSGPSGPPGPDPGGPSEEEPAPLLA
ncbi:MAG TPA: 6-pyruvoyl-tetrahydropterin synthase-related protein [Acidimicrobiia bacterium]|nr:6-pyruvoyl-tetrahydropterin synthase-related protein [Acidimicrobiia bacterium]